LVIPRGAVSKAPSCNEAGDFAPASFEPNWSLTSDSQLRDDLTVPLDVGLLQVVQQPTPLTDELQKATTGVVVLLVDLEVLGEVPDALGEKRDLHLGRSGIRLTALVVADDLGLDTIKSPSAIRTSSSRPAWMYKYRSTSGASTASASAAQRNAPRLMRNQ
jgi:hypothetical protein